MVFDSRDYRDAQPCYPALWHPHAALGGPSISRGLEIAYMCARRDARKIFDQHYQIDFRPGSDTMSRNALVVTSFARVAEAYRYIPDSTTHLVGEALYTVVQTDDTAKVRHRIVAVGAGTDTGATVTNDISPLQVFSTGDIGPTLDQYSLFSPNTTYRASFEVALSNAPAGVLTNVYVEVYATDSTSSTGTSYIPHFVGVWTEIRG